MSVPLEVKTIEPEIVPKKQARVLCGGRSESTIDEMIAKGVLEAVRDGKRIFITVRSIRDYVASLPPHTMRAHSRGRPARAA